MKLANKEIRDKAKAEGVRLWQICEEMGISEATMTRMLRNELPEKEAKRLNAIIDRIGGESRVES